jgi:hypothetical protein
MTQVGERSWPKEEDRALEGGRDVFHRSGPSGYLKRRPRWKARAELLAQSLIHISLCWAEMAGITNFDVVISA